MPRPLSEYSGREWRRIRPLVERYKQGRYLLLASLLLRQRPDPLAASQAVARVRGSHVLCVVAFNQPENIAMQAALVQRLIPGCTYLVADNSTDPAAAAQIAEIARRTSAIYLKVPPTPWKGGMGGRAHGFAMTWIWRHILRPGAPQAFGFIDHDIFPVRPTDPFEPLQHYPVAGRVWLRPPRWHLWAGFCFLRYEDVRCLNLDFSLDWYAGLDTGGGNWWELYRTLDPTRIVDPGCRYEPILPGISVERCAVEWLGDWLHESRFAYEAALHEAKHAQVMARLHAIATDASTEEHTCIEPASQAAVSQTNGM